MEVPTEAGRGLRGDLLSRSLTPAVDEVAEPADEALRVMMLLGREGVRAEGARKDLRPSGIALRAVPASQAKPGGRARAEPEVGGDNPRGRERNGQCAKSAPWS